MLAILLNMLFEISSEDLLSRGRGGKQIENKHSLILTFQLLHVFKKRFIGDCEFLTHLHRGTHARLLEEYGDRSSDNDKLETKIGIEKYLFRLSEIGNEPLRVDSSLVESGASLLVALAGYQEVVCALLV